MKTHWMRTARTAILGGFTTTSAFLAGAVVDPAPAGAHCGDHAGSCADTWNYAYTYCNGSHENVDVYNVYATWCSGTCYGGGTQGCCASVEACSNEPCKPTGGCGGACQFLYSSESGGYGWCD